MITFPVQQRQRDDLRFLKWIRYTCIHLLLRWTEFSKVSSIFMKNVILLRRVMIKYMLSVHIVSRLFLHPGGNCVGVASLTFIVPPHLISLLIPFYTGADVSINQVQCMCLCCALPFSLLLQWTTNKGKTITIINSNPCTNARSHLFIYSLLLSNKLYS